MQVKKKQKCIIGESITAGSADIKTFFVQFLALFIADVSKLPEVKKKSFP